MDAIMNEPRIVMTQTDLVGLGIAIYKFRWSTMRIYSQQGRRTDRLLAIGIQHKVVRNGRLDLVTFHGRQRDRSRVAPPVELRGAEPLRERISEVLPWSIRLFQN